MLLDLDQNHEEKLQLLARIKKLHPECEVIIADQQAASGALTPNQKNGIFEFLRKPFRPEEFKNLLQRMQVHLRTREAASLRADAKVDVSAILISQSLEMQKLLRIIPTVGSSRQPVLIIGESGTGKEALARAIHAAGDPSGTEFVKIDCASSPQALIEADLFAERPGPTTIFFDEVSALPLEVQGRLVRALQEQEIRRGPRSTAPHFGSRLIASTRVELDPACRQGSFRRDLSLRLQVVTLRIPPLRERREDIPLLARHVLAQVSAERPRSYSISNNAMKLLLLHEWPGNVSELEGCIHTAAALASGTELRPEDLPAYVRPGLRNSVSDSNHAPDEIIPLAEVEKNAILGALERLNGDKMSTARRLGIGKTTLYRKLREYGIADQWITRPSNH
jgi:two-component system response regulator HydG